MKKIFSFIIAGLALLGASSCVHEPLAIFDPSGGTAPVLGSYTVDENGITADYTPGSFNQAFNKKIAPNHAFAIVSLDGQQVSKTLTARDSDGKLTISKANLSKALIALGKPEGSTVSFDVAIRATMQDPAKDNGVNGFIDSKDHISVASYLVEIPAIVGSPYKDYTETSPWGLIGAISAYGINWDGDLCMWTDGQGNHVAAHVTLKAGDEVKFRKDQSWTENMGGDMGSVGDEFAISQDGPNIKIAKDGVYDLFMSESGTATVAEAFDPYPEYTEVSNWSVIGALSLAGINWDGDIAMITDGSNHVATDVALAADDEFKFRQDKAWTVNMGGDFAGLDSDFSVTQDGPNIKVGAAGTYDLFVNPNAGTAKVTAGSGLKISTKIGGNDEPEPEPEKLTGWNIIGLNGDWENDVRATESNGVWTAYITADSATEFKWRKDAGWDENYGGVMAAFGEPFAAVAGGDNIKVDAGFYKVTLDLSGSSPMITVYKDFTVWGLIGVNGDWNNDIYMTEDGGKWVSPATKISGEFKLRKNHGWDDNRGGAFTEVGKAFTAEPGGNNINVPEGEYVVTYDPSAETIVVDAAIPSNTWSLIGVNGDWNNDIFMTELMPGVWVSPEVEITAAGWKVRFNHGWDVNRGGATPSAEGAFVKAVPGGDNINLTGKFKVVYNANNETIGTLVWGVVGSIASIPGFSWNNDVPMVLAPDGKWFSLPVTLAAGDEIKIRKKAGWDENFGGDFAAANTPFAAVAGGNNIKAEGNYIVIYDPATGTLELNNQYWGLVGEFNEWGGKPDVFMVPIGNGKVAAYGQTRETQWKVRQGSDWGNNRGGVFAAKDALITAVPGGDNLTVPGGIPYDVVYDTVGETIFVGDIANMPADQPAGTSLKDFAKEFVKGLDVWAATVGNVDADGVRNQGSEKGAWVNVHFIPIVGNTSGDYYNYGNNQYDPKYQPWVLNVAGTEYSSSQAWEIAIRGLLNMCTTEGEAFLDGMTDRNKAYTVGDNLALSKAPVSKPSDSNKWGKNPWYEYGTLVTYNGNEIKDVDVNFMLKVGAWHVVRSFIKVGSNNPLGMIGNFQEFGTSSGTLNLDGYVGLISPMRELMVLMRIYKYLLDNNVDGNVYSAIKDQKFDFDLYGEGQGGGTKSIKSADDFIAWAAAADVDAVLEADITLPDTFVPDTLRANFDGKGHTVTYNLVANAENAVTWKPGLFSAVDGTVKNLKTAGSINASGVRPVGGIAASASGTSVFENCESAVEITAPTKYTYYLGGIVGLSETGIVIKNCKNTGTISSIMPDLGSGNASNLGGILGRTEGGCTITGCVNDGKIIYSAVGTTRTGGMVGYINVLKEASFVDCTNNGELLTESAATSGYNYVGGMTGYYGTPENGAHVLYKNCKNTGAINFTKGVSKTQVRAGGILCHCGGTAVDANNPISVEVINCSNSGDITTDSGSASQHIGGVIAFTEKTTCVIKCESCSNTGSITIKANGTIGSLLGYSCNPNSTFTDFTIGKDVVLTGGATAKAGMVIGSGYVGDETNLSTALTGEVKGGKIVKGDTVTELTADNYKENLVAAGFAGSVDGVKFTGSSSAAVSIKIDGNYDDWANVPSAEPSDAFKAFKVWNDAENFYFYVETDPGSRLWSGGAYLYLYFDWDNNLTTGEYSGTTGMGSNKYEAYTFMYIFENNTVGAPRSDSVAKGLKLDNLKIAGTDSSAAVVKFELSIPRADFDQQVKAGDVIGINSYRSKDGGNVYFPGYVVK